MASITKDKLVTGIWKNFLDIVKTNVKTTTLSDGTVVTITNYNSNYPDIFFETESNYPIIIIETPLINTNFLSNGLRNVNASIQVEVFTLQSLSADKFMEDIINQIELAKPLLASYKIFDIELEDTDSEMVERGAMKIHGRKIIFSFKTTYKRSGY